MAIVVRGWRNYNGGAWGRSLVSTIAALLYLSALYIPAELQSAGELRSKLVTAGVLSTPSVNEVTQLCLRWTCELSIVLLGEVIAGVLLRRRVGGHSTLAPDNGRRHSRQVARRASLLLMTVGAAAYVAFPAANLVNRADPGQGVGIILRGCLVAGVAIAIFYGHFESRWFVAASLLVTLVVAVSVVRSPLFLIAFAGLARVLVEARVRLYQVVAVSVALVLLAAIMSGQRANISRDQGLSLQEVSEAAIQDPLISVLEAGVDTLDGYRLSQNVSQYEQPQPGDLLRIVTTFVPRSLWPDKPGSVSVYVSHKYLGWNSSGIFLSPVGNLTLATGEYLLALLVLLFVSVIGSIISIGLQRTVWSGLVAYGFFRFFLNGSSFDFYYVLVFAVPMIGAFWLCNPRAKHPAIAAEGRSETPATQVGVSEREVNRS
ncbi:hypothetical protein TEK04_13895 [Klenkia sp. LSe6-5]|uniref:Oligosaccharide repeat unit polymerase n=1 Tax=Klenkia sesuvii TaxID=3103137 RepID=A0ABU8DVG2_9ACTN